jgi:type III secretory pathway component EscU
MDAAFVVTGSPGFAIMLDYRPPSVPVPIVLERTTGAGALRLRARAEAQRCPVIENDSIARVLYGEGVVGRPIPYDCYVAVAEVVAALMRDGALA